MSKFGIPAAAALVLQLTFATTANAAEWRFDKATISVDSDFSVGAAARLEDPDLDLIGRVNTTSKDPALKAACENPANSGAAETPDHCGNAYSTNGDDGNLGYDQGDLVSAVAKLTSDVTIKAGDHGFFFRGSYFFDVVNSQMSFFDPDDYGAGHSSSEAVRQKKIDDVQDHIGDDFDLLDAYFFGNFDIGDRYLSYRVGRQVLNWGESTFVLNGINSILALDANQARLPGATVDEIFLPQGLAFFAMDLTDNLGMELFYQYRWENTIIDASGSFYGTNDYAGIGGHAAEIGFGRCPENSLPGACPFAGGGSSIPREQDRDADHDGQGGIALRWYIEQLNDLDLGFYWARYHSRLPLYSGTATATGFNGVAGTATFFAEYPEDIDLYGISFNTLLPFTDIAMQGEYSYKVDQPLQVEDVELFLAGLRVGLPNQISGTNILPGGSYIQGFRRHDVSQVDISFTKIFGPSQLLGMDQTLLLFEAAWTKVHDMPDPSELRYEAPGTYKPGDANVSTAAGVPQQDEDDYADDSSWGYKLAMRMDYNNVFNVLTVRPSILFQHDVDGTTPTPIINFIEDRKQIRVGIEAEYLSTISFGVTYNQSFDGDQGNLRSDRDSIGANLRYSF